MTTARIRAMIEKPWAIDASENRENPEVHDIVRTVGWDIRYQQEGTGKFPERTVINQKLCEIQSGLRERYLAGIPPWDADLNYPQHAFVSVDGRPYVARVATGPDKNNPTDPATDNDVWREY